MQHQRDAGLRSRRSFMAAAGTALGTAALGVPGRLLAAPADINVGVILPLSGANAQFGINSRQGLELVADELNAAGGIKSLGGARIKLVIADATSQPTTPPPWRSA